MRRFHLAATVALAAAMLGATLAAGGAEASVVLDQSTFTDMGNGGGYVLDYPEYFHSDFGDVPLIQSELETVTAGVAGTLSEIDLKVGQITGIGVFNVLLFGQGEAPGEPAYDYGPTLFTAHLQAKSSDLDLFRIDVSSADFHVVPGQVFSFSIRPGESYGISDEVEYASTPLRYAGGENYISGNSGLEYDFTYYRATAQFQTFVNTGAPEPAVWAMMLFGVGAVGAVMRRRRVAAAPV